MAQFQYTAVNSAGKKLSGVIGAASEDEARKQLNTFGISVLAIQKTAETAQESTTQEKATSSELPKFEFEAFDKNGQKVLGTIPASSRYKAFKRLVDEYQFEVSYVVDLGATPEQKIQAKQEGLTALKAEYEAGKKDENKEAQAEDLTDPQFEQKRQALLKKVDYILEKIKQILEQYKEEIKPENKKLIQDTMDKLLRIKSSTNLDYIEHTSEELLKKVQDQELFLHKEQMQSGRDQLKLQTQELMAELHSKPSAESDGISKNIEEIQHKLADSESKLLKGLSAFMNQFVPTPEEKELKKRIASVNKQVWTYRKIWLTSAQSTKIQAKASLNKIIEERDRLKADLKALKQKRHAQQKTHKTHSLSEPLITEEITHFTGWLLGFYLLAYFMSHYVSAKIFVNGNPLPGDFDLLASGTLRNLLMSLFLWYILLSLRLRYLRYKSWANPALLGIGLLLNATLVFNL